MKKSKEEAAERKRAEKEAQKIADKENKEKQALLLASQAAYNKLFTQHAQLMADIQATPVDKRSDEKFTAAEEKAGEGDFLICQCLDAMRAKDPLPVDTLNAYAKSIRSVLKGLETLKPKRKK